MTFQMLGRIIPIDDNSIPMDPWPLSEKVRLNMATWLTQIK